MAKTSSSNKIRSTESLLSRNDITSLTALNSIISTNLLNTLTVIDTDDFQKLTNIQNAVSNKEIYIDQQISDMVSNYNRELTNYNEAVADFGSYGWNRTTDTTGFTTNNLRIFSEIARRYDRAFAVMRTIADPVSTTALDITTVSGLALTGGSLRNIIQSKNLVATKKNTWEKIVSEADVFDHTTPSIEIAGNTTIAQQLFEFGKMPPNHVSYGFFNKDAGNVGVGTITIGGVSTNCHQIEYVEGGSKKIGYLPTSHIALDPTNGQVRVGSVAVPPVFIIYDLAGNDITPKQDYTVEMKVGATYGAYQNHIGSPDWNNLSFRSTKTLVIKRSESGIENKDTILTNPAFTREFHRSIDALHRKYIATPRALEKSDSVMSSTIRAALDRNDQVRALTDEQKTELYRNILGLRQVNTVDNNPPHAPLVAQLFGGEDFAHAIGNISAWDMEHATVANHSVLFSRYVQSSDVKPTPSATDLENETNYRNWLTNNLATLTSNYTTWLIQSYLDNPLVVQAVNNAVTEYLTGRDHEEQNTEERRANFEQYLRANAQNAARQLRQTLPTGHTSQRNHSNNTWMRLMTGKGANVSDSVENLDKQKFTYTTAIHFATTPALSATIKINDEDEVTYHGRTPGDLLAKLLTGGGGRIDGQFNRMHLAFGTMKAIIKACRDAGMEMIVPINGTSGDELRINLDEQDNLKVQRYNFDPVTEEFTLSPTAGDSFDETNNEHKMAMTDDFLIRMNQYMNTIMDRQHIAFDHTMRDASSNIKNFGRWMTLDRERMSYKANPRLLRGLITKFINRKQPGIEAFSFPVTVGKVTQQVTYDPNGTITIQDHTGKTRQGKNLAKLLNPKQLNRFGGILNKRKNSTDGFEVPIMQGLYDGLSRQLMQNERVNGYTYLVRDSASNRMYAMYTNDVGEPKIGIIENVTRHAGSMTRSENMMLMDWQRWGRTKGIPPQAIRELNDKEQQAVLGRPEIMDGFVQNMMKAREEVLRIPVGGYRSLSLNATNVGRVTGVAAALAAVGGVNMATGGLLTKWGSIAGTETGQFITGTGPETLASVTKTTAHAIGETLKEGAKVVAMPVQSLRKAVA